MPASFPKLTRAMTDVSDQQAAPTWGEVMSELWPIISSPLSSTGERLLLDVIRHHNGLSVAESEEIPHSLSPDEMLKSLAVQALVRWTRLTFVTDLRRLELTVASSALQDVIRAAIQSAIANRPKPVRADAISEEELEVDEEQSRWNSTYQTPKPTIRRIVRRPVGRLGNLTIISGERPRKSRHKEDFELADLSI